MKAYLEKIGKEWMDDFVYISRQPLVDLGYEIIGFDGSDMGKFMGNNFQNGDIVVGSVEATVAFFKSTLHSVPYYLGYPESLKKYLHRTIAKVQFGALKSAVPPYFIKPADDVKKFTGCLVEETKSLDFLTKYCNIKDEDAIFISTPINIISEYRCFVHRGVLKGIYWYRGKFTHFPDTNVIQDMIANYKDAPVAYTLDVGILEDETTTALIEVNDFWAIGSYGFSGQIYARMIVDRFKELYRDTISFENNQDIAGWDDGGCSMGHGD